MPGRVVALHVAPRERAPTEARASVEVVADLGLEGDRYARAGFDGQITLVAEEDLAAAAAELGAPIAPGATRRNVTIAGVTLPHEEGERIELGPVLVEITGSAEPCGLMDRVIAPGAKTALRRRAGVRGRILRGGTLQVGDPVTRVVRDAVPS